MTPPASGLTPASISGLVQRIASLCPALPTSVALAASDDQIYHVLQSISGDDMFSTFNRRFDILFAEHLRDDSGRLLNIRRGQYGMDAVVVYLKSLDWSKMPLALVELKLVRICQELVYIVYVS